MKQYINNGQLIYCLANFDQNEPDVFISIPYNVDIVCTLTCIYVRLYSSWPWFAIPKFD